MSLATGEASHINSIDKVEDGSDSNGSIYRRFSPSLSWIEQRWSWIIVIASFWNQFIAVGILQILGIYNVEFLDAFGESKSRTAWVSSIAAACIMGLGPLAAMIMERTSARINACLGGLISTFGLLVSLFTNNMSQLSLTFGVIMGFGLCMVQLSSAVIVGQYFKKRRPLATGIASCGGSIGLLILPFYSNYIIEEYTWRWSLCPLAALCLQSVVFSSLLRPVLSRHNAQGIHVSQDDSRSVQKKDGITLNAIESSEISDIPKLGDALCLERLKTRLKVMIVQSPLSNMRMLVFLISRIVFNIAAGNVIIMLPDFIYVLLGSKDVSAYMLMWMAVGRILGSIFGALLGNWKPLYCLHMHCISCVLVGIVVFIYTFTANTYVFGILTCLFGLSSGAIFSWTVHVAASLVGAENLAHGYGYVMAACGLGRLIGPPLGDALCLERLKTRLKVMIVQSPLSNMRMLVFLISRIVFNIAAGNVIIMLPDFIYVLLGSKDVSAYMLMWMAVGRILGSIFGALLGNWKPLYCLHMHCISCVLVGIVVFIYTFTANTYVFGILTCLFGLSSGAIFSWTVHVAASLVGAENLAHGYGYVMAACGLGRLIGPPLGGVMFDISGAYVASFWMAGAMLLLSGLLPAVVPLTEKCKHQ